MGGASMGGIGDLTQAEVHEVVARLHYPAEMNRAESPRPYDGILRVVFGVEDPVARRVQRMADRLIRIGDEEEGF